MGQFSFCLAGLLLSPVLLEAIIRATVVSSPVAVTNYSSMNRSLIGILVLGTIIITVLPGQTTGSSSSSSRNARQAGRCSAGQQCILLTSCPELLALLNPPTPAGIRRLQRLTCAFDRRNPKVCCDTTGGGVNPTPVTPTRPTVDVTPGTGTSNLLPDNCGAIGEKVFGGDELPVRSYMWMALIGYGNRNNPEWGCGGSLISQRYVITAAHCADKRYTRGQSIVRVRLGEHDISKTRDCQQFNSQAQPVCAPPVQDFSPEKIIMHPTWDKRTNYSDDIALIRLDKPATFHGYVQPICLPPPNLVVGTFLNGREAEVAGWGASETARFGSDVRLMVKLPFVSLEKCKTSNHVPLLDKGQVCFGGVIGKDSCRGDSGGPLVGTDPNSGSTNLFLLLGVVSYGPPLPTCGIENRPAVYTDVAQYRNWIESELRP